MIVKYISYNKKLLNPIGSGHVLVQNNTIVNKKEIFVLKEGCNPYILKSSGKITLWEPVNFDMETTTVWSFQQRGDWASHNSRYRGNWSPYIPRNVILRYSDAGECVLDQFLGCGTTLIEAKLLNRKGIGVDINPNAIKIAKENLNFHRNNCFEPKVLQGSAVDLNLISDKSVDLICTHPPYANIIKYSENILGDLSLYEIDDFLIQMKKVAEESYRVLKQNKFCAIMMGDTRRKKHIIPLGFKVMQIFLDSGFILKEIIIKEQHNCKTTGYWQRRSLDLNFLLIAHEYLFIFRKLC